MTDPRPQPADFFADWKEREALAEAMIPLIGQLNRERNVGIYLYDRSLVNQSVIDIMKAHRRVRQAEQNEVSEFETYPMLKALLALNLGHAHIDLGKLATRHMAQGNGQTAEEFLRVELADALNSDSKPLPQPQDVVLYGFGRIGRLLARLL
ncbi:MAG: glyceraldehyde-3-phosphate dehydrogenase, partial [Porticoccaceae bacterium]|nr:glyceraldehyde-3-phosphate dehydrogenase [Porticoccaceae bacterium]